MTPVLSRRTRWLPFSASASASASAVRLYCLPHAGGSASVFRPWSGQLPGVAVCPVQPPGRETRLREQPFTRLAAMVDELADVVLEEADRPFAVYGHSLGGLAGFELVRELRRRGGVMPVSLIVSGCPAPSDETSDDEPAVGSMNQQQVVQFLRALGGTPEWLLADQTALRMILPPFQADFSMKESYGYRSEQPLELPITAIAATRDIRVTPVAMADWRAETSSNFELQTMVGGHFAVLEHGTVTLSHLARALRSWTGTSPIALSA